MTQEERDRMLPLLLSRSSMSSEVNKTGSWRFLRPRYDEKTAPCGAACPAGEDIARIEMLTAQGQFKDAWELILRENPFPGVCGRVCYHPCEVVCNRREYDEAVGIHVVERFLADQAPQYGPAAGLDRNEARRERVAVVGAGPAGLSAAYFLAILGYRVDVFEAAPEPGGLLRWGIPRYRLARSAVADEIQRIQNLGVRIHTGRRIPEDFLARASETHDGVFLSTGHCASLKLGIPGVELQGVEDGMGFLRRMAAGESGPLEGEVAVIGGGNSAIDVARTAVRLGARPVIIYRRRRQDMPAFPEEVEMALEEGARLLDLRSPVRIDRDGQGLLLTVQEMVASGVDAGARARVEPNPDRLERISVRRVFVAIGQEAEETWMNPTGSQGGYSVYDNSSMLLTDRGFPVIRGGDIVNDVKNITRAIASGKEGAMALDMLFRHGPERVGPRLNECRVGHGRCLSMEVYRSGARAARSRHVVEYKEINVDYFRFLPRIVQPRLLKAERTASFAEIDLRISASLAMREADRCFNCGICNQCDNCRLFCPDLAVAREPSPRGRAINYDYCKGCGVCVVECPRNAMSLAQEKDEVS
ncbi:MAG: FAD-dependent oxidoreductase [Syntrophobacteraceae bacterium]|nr:FAD-dependent oxidoreductase [Syntrophobacteraceae bacterium]